MACGACSAACSRLCAQRRCWAYAGRQQLWQTGCGWWGKPASCTRRSGGCPRRCRHGIVEAQAKGRAFSKGGRWQHRCGGAGPGALDHDVPLFVQAVSSLFLSNKSKPAGCTTLQQVPCHCCMLPCWTSVHLEPPGCMRRQLITRLYSALQVPGRPSVPCRCSAAPPPIRRCPDTSGLVPEGFLGWCQGLVCGISRLARGCSPGCCQ